MTDARRHLCKEVRRHLPRAAFRNATSAMWLPTRRSMVEAALALVNAAATTRGFLNVCKQGLLAVAPGTLVEISMATILPNAM